jgi:hypothetical protein
MIRSFGCTIAFDSTRDAFPILPSSRVTSTNNLSATLGSDLVRAKPSEMTRQWGSVGTRAHLSFGIAGGIIPQELA